MSQPSITLKSQYEPGPQGQPKLVFQFPAMALETPTGVQLVPNPNGRQAASFDTLEAALQAVHRAGFDAIWQGRTYPYRQPRDGNPSSIPLPTARLADPIDQAAAELVAPLLDRLRDKEVPVLTAALETLGQLQAPELLDHIEPLIEHESPEVRQSLAQALSLLGEPARQWVHLRYHQTLEGKQRPDVYRIRLMLVTVYTEMAKATAPTFLLPAMDQLREAMADPHWLVRAQAAQTLYYWALRREELKRPNS